jgi:imidazolonepropionase-like amidohydrolase
LRERWLGATGGKVPEIAVEGEVDLPEETLILDEVNAEALQRAHREGRPVAVRADTARKVKTALARPEVSCVLVPSANRDLLDLDLRELTYG